jgi:hypothetical protein
MNTEAFWTGCGVKKSCSERFCQPQQINGHPGAYLGVLPALTRVLSGSRFASTAARQVRTSSKYHIVCIEVNLLRVCYSRRKVLNHELEVRIAFGEHQSTRSEAASNINHNIIFLQRRPGETCEKI